MPWKLLGFIPWDLVVKYILKYFGNKPAVQTVVAAQLPDTPVKRDWLPIALGEIGNCEIPGRKDNARILEYGRSTTYDFKNDEIPWCAAFTCFCLEKAGWPSTRSARARSFETWGIPIEPYQGCIVVLWRKSLESGSGHVGFYMGVDPMDETRIMLLGGNQGNCVKISSYSKDQILGYRWPK